MQAIINAEGKEGQKNIDVEHNKKLLDAFGNERQFDIYWEYELCGIIYKTVIECKDYNSKIPVEKVDALIGKLKDFPNIRGLFATTQGYQSGAESKAKANGIELLLIRKLQDSDFVNKDGEPLIRGIVVNLHGILPAEILGFQPIADRKWLEENTSLDLTKPIPTPTCLETEIYINDIESADKFSMRDLRHRLQGERDVVLTESKTFKNAFLEYPNNLRFKLAGYNIKYRIPNWIESKIEISADDIYEGVIEYLSSGKKKMVAKDGKIKSIE